MEILSTLALIIACLIAVKLLVILIKPKAWMNVVEVFYAKPMITMVVCLVLAGVVLNYLLNAGIGILQIFAVLTFLALLGGMTMASYSKELMPFARKLLKDKKVVKKAWLPILVWIVLVVWALGEIFAWF